MRAPFVALVLLATGACGAPAEDHDGTAADDGTASVPVVLNIGSEQLRGDGLVLDLDVTIARFLEPAHLLPLERVHITAHGRDGEDLIGAIFRCSDELGYDVTGGDQFVIGQGEELIVNSEAVGCVPCGWTVICPSSCDALGPGQVPYGDPAPNDLDPADGDGSSGTGSGGTGSGGSGDSGASGSTGGSSGAGTGGEGGSHGGAGNPGGWG